MPSPNHDARREGAAISILVLHYTGMRDARAALARLCDPDAKVSAHYTVDEDGTVYAHVPEERRAWHAGKAHWRGENDVNSCSIGIEIVNPGHEFGYREFPDKQIEAVIALAHGIVTRHGIPKRNVVAHSDVALGRKDDPGELFPWKRLAEEGIGLWVEPGRIVERAAGPAKLQADLRRYGYGIALTGAYDAQTKAAVAAFQRHFRPVRFDGIADAETLARLEALLAAAGSAL